MMTRKFVLLSGGAIASLSVAQAPLLAQEVRTEVRAAASAGYQSNPFLESAAGNAGITTTIEVDPRVYLQDENSLISISGGARFDYLPEDGRTNDSFRINADINQRANERLSLSAGANFRTSRNALFDAVFADPSTLDDDDTLPDPTVIDVTIIGRQLRSTSYGLSAGADLRLSPISNLSGSVNANWAEFDGGFGNDFATTRGQLQYGRTLSETSTVGVVGAVSYTVFEGTGDSPNPFLALGGESIVADAQASFDKTLSPTAKISIQLGVSFIDFDLGDFGSQKNTIASGSVSFCEEALGGSFCLTGSRTAQPTALGGVSTVSGVGVGWTRRLSGRDTFSLAARYSEVEAPEFSFQDLVPQQRDSRIFAVSSSYDRQIGRDFSIFVSANYSEASGGVGNLPTTYGARAGISKTFGGSR